MLAGNTKAPDELRFNCQDAVITLSIMLFVLMPKAVEEKLPDTNSLLERTKSLFELSNVSSQDAELSTSVSEKDKVTIAACARLLSISARNSSMYFIVLLQSFG